jgi:hypothetical protein
MLRQRKPTQPIGGNWHRDRSRFLLFIAMLGNNASKLDWRNQMVSKTVPEPLREFLVAFARNLNQAMDETVIEEHWLRSREGGDQSRLHSRILGILAKTGFGLKKYTVAIEAGFRVGKSRSFRPDIQFWEKDKLRFLIEYESTNSSDSRILDRDLDYCYHALNAGRDQDVKLPDFWLIVYTLPHEQVGSWYHHDYPARKKRAAYLKMAKNPHVFYKKAFENPASLKGTYRPKRWGKGIRAQDCHSIQKCSTEASKTKREVFLINLTRSGLEIDFPKRLDKNEYRFKSPRSKR